MVCPLRPLEGPRIELLISVGGAPAAAPPSTPAWCFDNGIKRLKIYLPSKATIQIANRADVLAVSAGASLHLRSNDCQTAGNGASLVAWPAEFRKLATQKTVKRTGIRIERSLQ